MRKAMIIGSGAREHAIARVIKSMGAEVHLLPGNPGIQREFICHEGDPMDEECIAKVLTDIPDALVIIGPEAPLVNGMADKLQKKGFIVLGPGAQGAKLEGSKSYAKNFMKRNEVRTADFRVCVSEEECFQALESFTPPYVIKADGLASGKGVFIEQEKDKAMNVCKSLLAGMLGEAGKTLVIEQSLMGRELSYFVLFDGINHLILPPVQDYKKLTADPGALNTGGMGSFIPVTWETNAVRQSIISDIILPTLNGLTSENIDYHGVLFFGVMVQEDNTPFLLEYNVRFGDPETQSLMPATLIDWYQVLYDCAIGKLTPYSDYLSLSAVSVVLASAGYPSQPESGKEICGLENINEDNTEIYYANIKSGEDPEKLYTGAGRVLTLTAVSSDLENAREQVYESINKVSFEGLQYRDDIANGFTSVLDFPP